MQKSYFRKVRKLSERYFPRKMHPTTVSRIVSCHGMFNQLFFQKMPLSHGTKVEIGCGGSLPISVKNQFFDEEILNNRLFVLKQHQSAKV
ncbi:MAG: hypothetical protein IT258_19885 [Saprospiraceae bacterium]|nr:hypothetical protein [Saprospiraceae bacterium]